MISIEDLFNKFQEQPSIALTAAGLGDVGKHFFILLHEISPSDIQLTKTEGPEWDNSSNTQFTLTGTSRSLLGVAAPIIKLTVAKAGAQAPLQFQLGFDTDPNWTFSKAFPKLSYTEFDLFTFSERPRFILKTGTMAEGDDGIAPGLNFNGKLNFSNEFPALLQLIPEASLAIDLSGTVETKEHFRKITIRSHLSDKDHSISIPNFLSFNFSNPGIVLQAFLYKNSSSPTLIRSIESEVELSTTSSDATVKLPLALQLPSFASDWQIQLQPGKVTSLENFTEFLSLLASGGQFNFDNAFSDPSGKINQAKEVLQAITLNSFNIAIEGNLRSLPKFKSLNFELDSTNTTWDIIDNKLSLSNLSVSVGIRKDNGKFTTRGYLYGDIQLGGGLTLNANIPLPPGSGDWQLTSRHEVTLPGIETLAKFTDGTPLKQFLPKSLGDAPALKLAELKLVFNPVVGEFKTLEFAVSQDESWELIQGEFEMDSMYLRFTLSKGSNGWALTGKVQGDLVAGGIAITAHLDKTFPTSDWYLNLHANHIAIPSIQRMGAWVGGTGVLNAFVPQSVLSAELHLNNPNIDYNISKRKLEAMSFELTTENIELPPLTIEEAGLQVEMNSRSYPSEKKVRIYGQLKLAGTDIFLLANHSETGGWQLHGEAGVTHPIPLGNLVSELATKFGLEMPVPASFQSLELKNLTTSINTHSKDFSFSGEADFTLKGHPLQLEPTVNITHQQDGSVARHFTGKLTIGTENPKIFDLVVDQNTTGNSYAVATYHSVDGDKVSLSDLVGVYSDVSIPDALSFQLKQAIFAYNSAGGQFLLDAHMGNGIDLSHLPLVGKMFPDGQALTINYRILVASGTITSESVQQINSLLPGDLSPLANQAITDSPVISASINIAGQELQLDLPVAVNEGTESADPVLDTSPPVPAAEQAEVEQVKWIPIQKNIGPVHFGRIGMQFQNKELKFLLDAALQVGGLTISLEGLSAASPLTSFDPSFGLKGLGIDFKNEVLEVGASFLREHVADGSPNGYDEYDGLAILKMKSLSLSAIGSYAYINKQPSLFIYAALNEPLGGPAFFFVTGISAGFGYNRSLHMPSLDHVLEFPLVAEALNGKSLPNDAGKEALTKELEAIHSYIPPNIGHSFLAAGISFTSFKLIESTLLLAANFGNRFELDLLGVSTLVVPPEAGDKALAVVQMVLKGAFIPDEGFAGLQGKLTPASYILSKDCHLSGGFAFFSWFKGSHKGDFVATIGGYHPSFKVPAHYPKVPRLRFNWNLDSHTTLKGGAYFALCAHALMAGGHLQANYHNGALSAWFSIGMDVLVAWKPYHYEASAYVRIGGAYTYHFFGTHHISVDVGSRVNFWGPDFGGHAEVDLSICSIGVNFGASRSSRNSKIDWNSFNNSFLPQGQQCSIVVKNGLVGKGKTDKHLGAIDPKTLVLSTDAFIPSKVVNWGDQTLDTSWETGFGIGPMDLPKDQLQVTQSIKIEQHDDSDDSWKDVKEHFDYKVLTKKTPAGLWGEQVRAGLNDKRFIENTFSGLEISPKEGTKPADNQSLDPSLFAYATSAIPNAFNWEQRKAFDSHNLEESQRRTKINESMRNKTAERKAILDSLDITVTLDFTEDVGDSFTVAPQVEVA